MNGKIMTFAVVGMAIAAQTAFADAGRQFQSTSPDGLNELRLNVDKDGMVYSVLRRGKVVVEPTAISLKIDGRGWLDGKAAAQGRTAPPTVMTRKVEGTLATPIYKKSSIDLAANEVKVDFGDWAVRLHARNDGVAWRFETEFYSIRATENRSPWKGKRYP